MIERKLADLILEDLTWSPIVAVVGPRQVGKTTLVKSLMSRIPHPSLYLDLELTSERLKLEDAETYLDERQDKLVIIDEVQLMPELFSLLRALVDRNRRPARFILLGSASPHIVRKVTETLAGRIVYHELTPFSSGELPATTTQRTHWLRGGFPDPLLAPSYRITRKWIDDFIETFIQRDLSRLGYIIPKEVMRRLISMVAHMNGELLNKSNLGKSLGVTHPTVEKYLELLEGSFIIRRLPAFHENTKKQLVKSPKMYLRDSGLLHHLLRIGSEEQLLGHPAVGNSWEVFAIEQIIREAPEFSDFFFYRARSGAEIDLLMFRPDGKRWAVEIKLSNSPKLSKGFFAGIEDTKADASFVITPGSDTYTHKGATVCSLRWFLEEVL